MNLRLAPLALAAALLLPRPAAAFIERLYSLKEVLAESSNVCVGRIEKVDATKKLAIAAIDRTIKGKAEFKRVQMNLGTGPRDHVKYLMARLRPGIPVIVYYQRKGNSLASCVHAADTWYQLFGTDSRDRSKVWWRFTHLEVAMPRTYSGSTPDLIRLTTDVLAGRAKPPKPNASAPRINPKKIAVARPPRTAPAKPTPTPRPVAPAPKPLAGNDGLEAIAGWAVEEDWGRPAKLDVLSEGPRGKVMHLDCNGRPDAKLAVTILHYVDFSNDTRLSADVDNPSDRPLAVAVAFGSAPDWEMFETPPVTVPAKAKAARVSFPLAAAHFKCKSSAWKHNKPLPKRTFDKVTLLVEGLPTRARVAFDRIVGASAGFRKHAEIPHGSGGIRGISWADANGDDQLDALLCCGGGNLLLINDGGTLADRTKSLGIRGGSRAAAWADYNADDHPDLLTNDFQLFTNVGAAFRDDSKLIRVSGGRNPEGAGWIDYNGDGRPDILITNGEHGICLLENTGKGPNWFRDVSDKAGLGRKGLGRGNGDFIAFADVDGDGYTDFLYNLGDGVLALNQGDGTFKPDTRSGIRIHASNDHKRGHSFADYDNDGDLDLFVPAPAKPRLYRNNNDGTFTDVLPAAGALAASPPGSVAAAWGDVNADGCLDLFVCHSKGTSRLYLGDGAGSFTDATKAAGLAGCGPAFAASFADVDGDRLLDLLVNLERKAVLYHNALDRPATHAPVIVRIHARAGRIGAVVRALDPKGRPLGLRELNGAESWGGQAPPVAHFGLPLGQSRISVCLSDGRVAQKPLTIPPAGTTLTLTDADFK